MSNRVLAPGILLAALCLVATAGCADPSPAPSATGAGDSTGAAPTSTPGGSAAPSATEAPKPAASGVPSASVTPSSPSATRTSTPSARSDPAPAGRLMPPGRLPGFNADFRWKTASTRETEPRDPVGTCQRFALTSIGAERVAVRTYRPASGAPLDQATQQVAVFPDDLTARRAYAVLGAWRSRCADRLSGYRRTDVGASRPVQVAGGTAGWYLLTYGPVKGKPDEGYFDAQGAALVGSRITTLSMVLAGQDYNYEPGQEPMVAALQRAARLLS